MAAAPTSDKDERRMADIGSLCAVAQPAFGIQCHIVTVSTVFEPTALGKNRNKPGAEYDS
jgi:hypothetical protein